MTKPNLLKITVYLILFFIFCLFVIVAYYYQEGRVKNYVPPAAADVSAKEQVVKDFTELARAIEAYDGMNLRYPDSLSQLQPDFVAIVPIEPGTGRPYVYRTDGTSTYAIAVQDPAAYQLKKFTIENGKVIEQ